MLQRIDPSGLQSYVRAKNDTRLARSFKIMFKVIFKKKIKMNILIYGLEEWFNSLYNSQFTFNKFSFIEQIIN